MPKFTFIRPLMLGGAALAAMLLTAPAQAQGDLLVAPTRVVINSGGSAEVVLSNIGSQVATYRIALELRRMSEDGDFSDVAEADANPVERAALDMVRYAPRRITLSPGQPQSVRISVRPPEGLPDGEYRVHMSFRAVPTAATPEENAKQDSAGGVSIKLVPIYGITIPVFLRKGRLEASASLANPHVVTNQQGAAFLEVTMNRTGQRSVFGEVLGRSPKGEILFTSRGIAVYPEINKRQLQVPLSPEQAAKLKGPIKLEYRELPENGGALITELSTTFK